MSDEKPAEKPVEKPAETHRGDHNLFILGIISIVIAIVTTVVSLIIYHKSGDIYLDRSRPGFLPDEEEVTTKPETTYSFPSSGTLTDGVLDDYILHFEEAIEIIDDLHSPFSETPLSDESLGIPAAPAEDPAESAE